MHLYGKEVKPLRAWRLIVMAVFVLTVGALAINGLVYAMSKQVEIVDDNGYYEKFITYKATAADILAEKEVVLQSDDEINFAPDKKVPDGARITVSRAVMVKIDDGGNEYLKRTAKKTVGALLQSLGIDANAGIKLNTGTDSSVVEGMTLKIVYVKEELVTAEEVIPYKVTKKSTTKLEPGKTRVLQEGSEGLSKNVYKVSYENNKEVARELVEKTVVTAAKEKIVEYGAAQPKVAIVYGTGSIVSRSGEFRYKGVITCSASAYCIKGRTATGTTTKVGTVAVDPKVIPLGTRLYIEAPDGSWTYGSAVAADTGGAIKGNKIDLYMETYQEAIKFGRRTAKVYILE
ncbi:MAG: Cell wall-binding protein YocH precursor [Firmicutes bacterium ADurb.Bin193]|nr:MAG: Cell wall-binding protein YocH precursor [Firmicutes bacterium ADurb.Bin193]